MSAPAINPLEAEQERQRLVNELIAEHGPNWSEQYKPGSFGCHELLDRASLTSDMVEQLVLSHPACLRNAEWYALAEQAAAALQELYQRVGAEHLDDDEGSGEPS
ncbi:MAG TPA: hypothetical protein DDY78_00590 [Planctomycetales bacterium]|nr:hypothetical protein [Planctomycetales bacterium]